MKQIAGWITETVAAREDETKLKVIREEVRKFSLAYPVPGIG